MRRLALLAALAVGHPAALAAEGARLTLACKIKRGCDHKGECYPFEGPQAFTLAPLATDENGTGDWTITPDGEPASPARGLSHTGPWVWHPEGDGHLHTLALTGEASAIWIRQWLPTKTYPETYAEMDIMLCEVTG